jgi:hypothetical protein
MINRGANSQIACRKADDLGNNKKGKQLIYKTGTGAQI